MSDNDDISSNKILLGALGGLGLMLVGLAGWAVNNTSHIPVIESKLEQQHADLDSIKSQIIDVPVIRVQMDNITKQLDHINSAQDAAGQQIEETRNKLSDHERRIQQLELTKRR